LTRRLAVVAHYDPDGLAAPHVLRLLDQLSGFLDEVMVVSSATLTPRSRLEITERAELIERENFGRDFAGWQHVLHERLVPGRYHEILLTNDTYVGLLRPIGRIFAEMRTRPVEMWGTHESFYISRHIQSFFVVFTEPVLRSRAFDRFWRRMRPSSSRMDVVLSQEIGLSQQILDAGFEIGGYFQPHQREVALGADRERWWKEQLMALDVRQGRPERWLSPLGSPLNPAIAYADAALDDGRMPLVKIDTLRYDPYFLGTDRLISLCEERYPEHFDGVREYLQRTKAAYPVREGENDGVFRLPAALQETIGYHVPDLPVSPE
jgi:hypothetical protein